MAEQTSDGKPKCSNLQQMIRTLRAKGFVPVVIVDSSIAGKVDNAKEWTRLKDRMQRNKMKIVETPEKSYADHYILQYADEKIQTAEHPRIVSNDKFAEYLEEFPWLISGKHQEKFIIKSGRILWG